MSQQIKIYKPDLTAADNVLFHSISLSVYNVILVQGFQNCGKMSKENVTQGRENAGGHTLWQFPLYADMPYMSFTSSYHTDMSVWFSLVSRNQTPTKEYLGL